MNVKNPAFILAGSTYRNLVFRRQCVNVTRGQHRRVVVTGLGLVTPLGVGVTTVWQNLVVGKCGITRIEREDYDNIPAKIAAFVPRGENPGKLDKSYWQSELKLDKRSTTTEGLFAVVAAHEAIADSKWMPEDQYQRERTGYKRVNTFYVPRVLLNMPAGLISMTFGLQGPNYAVSTACAAGAHAIGDAYRMISYGDADVMVTGGVEACIVPVSMAGFCKMRALTTKFNDRPHEASRPFDSQRSGFVMGEGAGVMILEEHEHAVSRGAKIYAEIIGYGLSGDAYHITAPSEGGYGAYLAMKNALGDARLEPQDIHYINAHATSTPIGDAGENNAIKTLLGSHAKNIKVSSVKGAIGHLLGASGAVEAIFTVLSVAEGVVPPTLNLHSVDSEEEFDLNYVPLKSQQLHAENARTALTNSFGFGGTNASLCFRQFIDSN
ncbi:3-oxoacyl-[acyl-carrier-protein] synthase, mitochondrial-like isoform X2 [Acropora muricata]|uniref:3-oxoacyl-[acyl-carrier-protein] synthase, mitochondrial-like isoform X2 n=1 Tax=Acropora muricata TaxID=159855 RepID=UPI0034E39F76